MVCDVLVATFIRESGRVEAGRRKLREVHLGVSWLNRQRATAENLRITQKKMRKTKCKTQCVARLHESRQSVCRVKAQENKLGWYRGTSLSPLHRDGSFLFLRQNSTKRACRAKLIGKFCPYAGRRRERAAGEGRCVAHEPLLRNLEGESSGRR